MHDCFAVFPRNSEPTTFHTLLSALSFDYCLFLFIYHLYDKETYFVLYLKQHLSQGLFFYFFQKSKLNIIQEIFLESFNRKKVFIIKDYVQLWCYWRLIKISWIYVISEESNCPPAASYKERASCYHIMLKAGIFWAMICSSNHRSLKETDSVGSGTSDQIRIMIRPVSRPRKNYNVCT